MEIISNVLAKKRRVKKTYSGEEKLAIIDSFKHSGLSGRAFCRRENISVSTLYKWVRLTSQAQIITETNHKKSKNFIFLYKEIFLEFEFLDFIVM